MDNVYGTALRIFSHFPSKRLNFIYDTKRLLTQIIILRSFPPQDLVKVKQQSEVTEPNRKPELREIAETKN